MKNNIIYFIWLFVFCPVVSFSQEFKCGLNSKLAKLYAEDPQLEKDHEALFKNGFQEVKKGTNKMVVFTIPIVFHIIHYNGSENINDAQVYDAVRIINEDFRSLNADTSIIIPEFKSIYADVGIEFKLATKDPAGNCTNGIEHIYSHETFQGDDYSKLNQWHRSKYLNVWIVDKMEDGVAGYAYYPTSVDGMNFFRDGIIILNNYIGSFGTGTVNGSRALTHEIGHYLGLAHPWGSTNEPGVSCGDDFIPDTPITRGSNLVCNLNLQQCNAGIIENVQNFMDYSYCSNMFTADQATAMRNILQGEAGNRNILLSEATRYATGIDLTTTPICAPIAYFKSDLKVACIGENVQFTDQSYNAEVTGRQWFFQDGTASSLTSLNPVVTFSSPGYKQVKLIVSSATGQDSVVSNNYIFISTDWADFTGPTSIDFENPTANWFIVDNPEDNKGNFELISSNGFNNSRCYRLDNFKDVSNATQFSNDYFYNDRLGGTIDALTTPSFDLSTTTNVEVSFKYAYATNADALENITETLRVYSSRNCGKTWNLRETITGAELLTAGSFGYTNFVPSTSNFWKTGSFVYNASSQDVNMRFKFEFTASDYSNNFYLDDINIGGILDVSSISGGSDFSIYPNPSSADGAIIVSFYNDSYPTTISVRDALGKLLFSYEVTEMNQDVEFNLSEKMNLSAGCYFVSKQTRTGSLSKKLMVLGN
jgi:PKD repeat protein